MFDIKDLIILMGATTLVFVPALAITARLAMKPIVENIIKLREAFGVSTSATSNRDQEIRLLRAEIDELRAQVDELKSLREFDHALTPPHGDKLLSNKSGQP
jgi:hypothetical protein